MRNQEGLGSVNVAIIGAGPYGLSIAAHLNARNADFRIFGHPMSIWATRMPRGMRLKSEGFASSLSDAASQFTLGEYCRQQNIPYEDVGRPVELDTFVAYGLAFQEKFVPNLERRLVTSIRQVSKGFELLLDNGEKAFAARVVVAVGISYYDYVPPVLASLPSTLMSHSSAHCDLGGFSGRRVAVIGAGASALDLAGLLHAAGTSVDVIARTDTIRFQDPPRPRSLMQRLRNPRTGIGSGPIMVFYARMPHCFRLLPERIRLQRLQKTLGPAPGWFAKGDTVGKVALHTGRTIISARYADSRVLLDLRDSYGRTETLETDHVISATGFRVDLDRVAFLDSGVRDKIRKTGDAPVLSANFESSVPGLYFVGVSAASSFGPLMRFAYGAEFTARRLARHLVRTAGFALADHSSAKDETLHRSAEVRFQTEEHVG
ncbi:MAG TPA: NAD(P)-binding domain-containing protein [Acidobacteriaceae bacterium]|nr:NAD(P)-binding domain-containing protein [Acidobacteriaceae bacterium]